MTAKHFWMAAALAIPAVAPAMAQIAVPAATITYPQGFSTSWLAQIGVTNDIENQANGGAGFVIGLVDTGIVSTQMDVVGRVSILSSCAAVTFTCSRGVTDDNGHGTATAAIAAGSAQSNGGMSGVAPRATILAEKVLDASGSGYDIDVANGITKAANAGAEVINLSLTYLPTNSVISAINYATSKGAIIVFAGGNSAAALNGGADTAGLTSASLSRIVFAGSVSATNQLSSFSNTPGTGAVGGATRTPYASLWLDAPGENIVAPGIQFGSKSFAYWTGTSMAAPMVSGALALLETTWPVLNRNGTATAVLFQSSTDLGAPGVDAMYGSGLLNLTQAFLPLGALTVLGADGSSIAISSLTGTEIGGGVLGPLSSLTALLSHYTSFDSFQRNFTVDLSGLLSQVPPPPVGGTTTPPAGGTTPPPPVTHNTTPPPTSHFPAPPPHFPPPPPPPHFPPPPQSHGRQFSSGDGMSFVYTVDTFSSADGPGANGANIMSGPGAPEQSTGSWMMTLRGNFNGTVTVGHGFPAAASFAEAMWGANSVAADAAYALTGVNDVSSLAQGGHFMTAGADIDKDTRFGISWTQSGNSDYSLPSIGSLAPHASALDVGLSTRLAAGWTAGMTASVLDEQYGLLGAVYSPSGIFSLGRTHATDSVGVTSAFALGKGVGLLFNAVLARTSSSAASGLVSSVSPLWERAYAVALVQQNAFSDSDRLSVSLSKPLRVYSGSLDVVTTTVDDQGYAHTGTTSASLRPGGDETDFSLGYAKYWGLAGVSASLGYRDDANNWPGVRDLAARLDASVKF